MPEQAGATTEYAETEAQSPETRFRLDPRVESELARLRPLGAPELQRLLEAEEGRPETRKMPETLVCMARERFGSGDDDVAWMIASELIDRNAATIFRNVRCWHLPPQHEEDCIRDIQMEALQSIRSREQNAEFWTVRFGLCLKRLTLNVIDRYAHIAAVERASDRDEAHDSSRLESIEPPAGAERLNAQERAEAREALALLAPDQRMAFVLYHYEQWDQREIAERLGKTDRTVRNLLRSAEETLESWRAGNAPARD
jgi:RNA polymerase sigma factor (sigma-70 family)